MCNLSILLFFELIWWVRTNYLYLHLDTLVVFWGHIQGRRVGGGELKDWNFIREYICTFWEFYTFFGRHGAFLRTLSQKLFQLWLFLEFKSFFFASFYFSYMLLLNLMKKLVQNLLFLDVTCIFEIFWVLLPLNFDTRNITNWKVQKEYD